MSSLQNNPEGRALVVGNAHSCGRLIRQLRAIDEGAEGFFGPDAFDGGEDLEEITLDG